MFSIYKAVYVNGNDISFLHPPADHRKDINNEKCAGEEKVEKILAKVKREKSRQKEQKRQSRDDGSTLQKMRGRTVNSDELSKRSSFVRHLPL